MLSEKEIQFIQEHSQVDVSKLAFAGSKYPDINLPKVLFQIKARQKLVDKLPTWVQNKQIYFPPQLSLEQSSSEKTALFKAKLIQGNILDLTSGMGIDDWAFGMDSKNTLTTIEIQKELKEITEYNHKVLGLKNIHHLHADGMDFLSETQHTFDWIYVDPARRDTKGQKVFLLKDCSPDATHIVPFLGENTGLLVKASPMLDISLCIQELNGVTEVHILCIKNEIKELLFKKDAQATDDPELHIWDLNSESALIFSGHRNNEKIAEEQISGIEEYVYEPHVGILKAGFFKLIQQLGVKKLATNTHLYTSKEQVNFPGRSFKVIEKGKLDPKWIKPLLESNKLNVTCRNSPLNAIEVQKKLKVSDGGNQYLFVYRNQKNETEVALCQKTYQIS